MENQRVTCCLGTWNAAAFVERTLRGLMAQTHEPVEFVVADDASTDGTFALCQSIVGDDPRFRLVRRERNLGWCRNYAALVADVRTPFVCFAFHDDVVRPTYLSELVAALQANESAVLAYSDLIFGSNDFVPLSGVYTALDRVQDVSARLQSLIRMRGSWWIPFRGVMRTSAALRCRECLLVDGPDTFSADWIWLIDMAMEGEFVRVPQTLYEKHWLRTGATMTAAWRYRDEFALRLRCLRELRRRRPTGWPGLCLTTAGEIAKLPLRRVARRIRVAFAKRRSAGCRAVACIQSSQSRSSSRSGV